MMNTYSRALHRSSALAGLLGAALSGAAAFGQDLTSFDVSGSDFATANGVSPNGAVVIGQSSNGGFRRNETGEVTLFDPLGDGDKTLVEAKGISGSGKVVVGSSPSQPSPSPIFRAFRWTEAGGVETLGTLGGGENEESYANAVSDDGAVVVGLSEDTVSSGGSLSSTNLAFKWTASGGMVSLGTLDGDKASEANGISGDGKVIVGSSSDGMGGNTAVFWTDAGIQSLGSTKNSSFAHDASDDGSVIVGSQSSGRNRAFRWTAAGGITELGLIGAGLDNTAYGVSADGLVVVGQASTSSSGTQRAFRWTEADGMITVEDWLRNNGATIATDITQQAKATSCDGSVVVGTTSDSKAFIARVPSTSACLSAAAADADAAPIGGSSGGDTGGSGGDTGGGTDSDTGGSTGDSTGGSTGGTGATAGIITIDSLSSSLASAGGTNSASITAGSTVLNGIGSRPLDRRVSGPGRMTAWLAGDLAEIDHGASDGDLLLGEIGAGYDLGGAQINLSLGLADQEQNTSFGGAANMDAVYVKAEALTQLLPTADGGLWGVATAYGLWGDADISRAYLVGGGAVDASTAAPDLDSWGGRLRLEWENALPSLSPYAEISHSHSCLDAYTETGGSFPASFDELCDDVTEARGGVDATIAMTDSLNLIGVFGGVHRFQDQGPTVRGNVVGLAPFTLPGADYEQTWVRGGLGLEADLGGAVLSGMANATSQGEAPSLWLAASLRVNF